MSPSSALAVARRYHDGWTARDFAGAAALLADDLDVEVPLNAYAGADDFAAALAGFGAMTRRVDLIAALGGDAEAMLLYDMEVDGLGELRVAEHFTVADGRIVRLRQIHDTAALRAAGFARADMRRTIRIEAPLERVYAALVEPDGLRGWWTTRADVATEVGGLTRFAWSDSDHTTFRIDRLDAPTAVEWTCVAQRDGNLPDPAEWVGTRVRFRLAPCEGGTELDFRHEGLADLDCGDVCAGGWDFFLRRSLKPLVESGRGAPWHTG